MVITHGFLLDSQEVVTQLIEAQPNYIKLSVQLLNDYLFSRARTTPRSFQEYKNIILRFLGAVNTCPSKVIIDIACNFQSGIRQFKKLLGLEHGDPSVYNTIDDMRNDVASFLREVSKYVPAYQFNSAEIDDYLDRVSMRYLDDEGFAITHNISVKIKPFQYGRRFERFYPVRATRPCTTRILGILASGCVVPCSIAYEDSLSLGNIREESLKHILDKNKNMLHDIKQKGINLPALCRRCLGAPTKRGAMLKQIKYALSNLR